VSICRSAPKSDIAVLILTFVLTVVFDLVVAIEIGLLVTMVLFMKRMSDVTEVRSWDEPSEEDDRMKEIPPLTRVFEINGPLFFATTDRISTITAEKHSKVVILRMRNIPMLDISALRMLKSIYKKLRKKHIRVLFSHMNEQPMSVAVKSGFYEEVGAEYFLANIDEALEKARTLIAQGDDVYTK
jgi:SulP family sulfate permease